MDFHSSRPVKGGFAILAKTQRFSGLSEEIDGQIRERLAVVCEFPESGYQTEHGETRMVAMSNFSIYYRYDESRIVVMAFWDNRQNPDKLLKLLESQR